MFVSGGSVKVGFLRLYKRAIGGLAFWLGYRFSFGLQKKRHWAVFPALGRLPAGPVMRPGFYVPKVPGLYLVEDGSWQLVVMIARGNAD